MTIGFLRDQAFGTKDAFFVTKYKNECIVNQYFDDIESECSSEIRYIYLTDRKLWDETARDLSYCFCGL